MQLIPVALAATIAGSLLAPFYSVAQDVGWSLLVGSLSFALFFRKSYRAFLLFLLLVFFLLANLRYPLQFPADPLLAQIDAQKSKVDVTAQLKQVRQLADERSSLDLQLIRLVDNGRELPLTTECRLRLYVGERVAGLLPGDMLSFTARLRKPRLFGTPGEFHWPRYLASQNIALSGWLKSADQLTLIDSNQSYPLRHIMAWKERAAEIIEVSIGKRSALLVRALILGEAKLLPDPVRDNLAQAGISHLFAISGLHLGLLGMLGYRLLFCLYRRSTILLNWQPPQRVLPLLLLPLLFGYLLLTGDAVATRRAFCLASFAAAFWWLRYTVNPLRLLLFLALLFLLVNPLLLWQPSWQLSFSGAAGILLWRPLWAGRFAEVPALLRGPARLFLVTLAATLATLPLVLVNFHLLAPAGLLANLFAVPIVALLALPIGLCGLIFLDLTPVAEFCFSLCAYLLDTVLLLTEKLLLVPGLSAEYLFLCRWQYVGIGLLLLPMILHAQPWMKRARWQFVAGCLLLALLSGYSPAAGPAELSLYMLSVGQGESLLLTNRSEALLVDGGGLYSNRFDVGERLLAPALGELGVNRLTAVVLTHDHPDHRKGLIFVLRHFPVETFWSGVAFADLHPQLQAVLTEKKIPVRSLPAGWTDVPFPEAEPLQIFSAPERQNKNNSSLVLYVPARPGGLLLTGDLEKRGVRKLIAAGVPGPVSVLKLPHHGSRHSNTEELLKLLQPDVCLASAGYQNRYGFPARQLVEYLQRQNVPLYRTDIMGTVRVRNHSDDWQIDLWKDGLFR